MKTILLFGMFPSQNYQEIINNSKGVIQYAADALQKSFIEGLGSLIENLEIVNLPYIGSYPNRYKKFFLRNETFEYTTQNNHRIAGINIGFCNLTGYKMYSRYINTLHYLDCFLKRSKEEVTIVIYAIYTPFIKACVELKHKYKLRIVLIVPDLPEYMGGKRTFILDRLREHNKKILTQLYREIDGYVLLSKYMADELPIKNKPWTVVEGIFNNVSDFVLARAEHKENTVKTVFYSGTLAKRYGVLNLVEAFSKLNNINYKLEICGAGDGLEIIKDYSRKDSRIIYKGQLPRNEVLELQRQAFLLINPRTPEGEFTKFSFPSKTMEYLASGTPTLLYKLPGIPDEYYDYCFSLEDTSISALSQKIDEILSMDYEVLKIKSLSAQKFILENKNPIAQSQKVVNLINQINNHVSI